MLAGCAASRRDRTLDWPLPHKAAACTAPIDSAPHASFPSMRAGRYELTLVATRGSETGRAVRGRLWLNPTSAADRSPRTGETLLKADTLVSPLYGATDIEVEAVGAPMMADTSVPSPRSTDPIYPGVRVVVMGQPKQPTMLIGTLTNVRNGSIGLDGAGIGLFVSTTTEQGFVGRWGPWGIMANGSGYFCARPLY